METVKTKHTPFTEKEIAILNQLLGVAESGWFSPDILAGTGIKTVDEAEAITKGLYTKINEGVRNSLNDQRLDSGDSPLDYSQLKEQTSLLKEENEALKERQRYLEEYRDKHEILNRAKLADSESDLERLKSENEKLREALGAWLSLRVTFVTGIPVIDANNKEERAAIEKALSLLTQSSKKA